MVQAEVRRKQELRALADVPAYDRKAIFQRMARG